MSRLASTSPSFGEGVAVAIAISLAGYCAALVASPTIAITVVAGCYLAYLLSNAPITTGRVTAATGWLLGTAIAATLDVGHWHLLLWHVGSAWLLRSWCYLDTVLQALLDLGLWLVALAMAFATLSHTANLGLALWVLLLIQATWPLLAKSAQRWVTPPATAPALRSKHPRTSAAASFDESRQAAEAALKQIHSPTT